MGLVAQEQPVADQRGVGHAHTPGVVDTDEFVLLPGLEYKRVAGFTQRKNVPAIGPR